MKDLDNGEEWMTEWTAEKIGLLRNNKQLRLEHKVRYCGELILVCDINRPMVMPMREDVYKWYANVITPTV